ncbi:response regulator transcription factor [Vibrio sp. SM6]|uniref:Response regulator transcription factor n=1 Tax=Vibrio agarilyticus TaxID=2726741 RepID=A0A7X8YHQ3_9VIBR|nr:response regulator [Vibrio agarilyticus]NLS13751.1 response regulator transcription factor [Vibrio agarilyticus]
MNSQWSLFLVDDDEAVLDALSFVLEGEGYQPHSFSSADAFWAYQNQQTHPLQGALILDSRMPGMSGQELQRQLCSTVHALSIVFLTGHGDVPMAVDALKLGASDFLQKPVERDTLLAAVENALERSVTLAEKRRSVVQYQNLTARERDLLQLYAQGLGNNQIADQLHISVRTVEVHKSRLLQHLGVDSLADMVRLYTMVEPELKHIPPPPSRIKRNKSN